jgi:hypothetical protein
MVRDGLAQEMHGKVGSFQAAGNEVAVDFNEVFDSPGFV